MSSSEPNNLANEAIIVVEPLSQMTAPDTQTTQATKEQASIATQATSASIATSASPEAVTPKAASPKGVSPKGVSPKAASAPDPPPPAAKAPQTTQTQAPKTQVTQAPPSVAANTQPKVAPRTTQAAAPQGRATHTQPVTQATQPKAAPGQAQKAQRNEVELSFTRSVLRFSPQDAVVPKYRGLLVRTGDSYFLTVLLHLGLPGALLTLSAPVVACLPSTMLPVCEMLLVLVSYLCTLYFGQYTDIHSSQILETLFTLGHAGRIAAVNHMGSFGGGILGAALILSSAMVRSFAQETKIAAAPRLKLARPYFEPVQDVAQLKTEIKQAHERAKSSLQGVKTLALVVAVSYPVLNAFAWLYSQSVNVHRGIVLALMAVIMSLGGGVLLAMIAFEETLTRAKSAAIQFRIPVDYSCIFSIVLFGTIAILRLVLLSYTETVDSRKLLFPSADEYAWIYWWLGDYVLLVVASVGMQMVSAHDEPMVLEESYDAK